MLILLTIIIILLVLLLGGKLMKAVGGINITAGRFFVFALCVYGISALSAL